MAEFGRTASFSRPGLQRSWRMRRWIPTRNRNLIEAKGGIRLVYVWAHCDVHIFAKYIEINCLDQRNLTSFQHDFAVDPQWLPATIAAVGELTVALLSVLWSKCFCTNKKCAFSEGQQQLKWEMTVALEWSLPNYENFETQRKPGAKSCLESSASVIPFVRWNRYHRQMYSTSWIDARDNSDQEEPSVHKNPRLHILQDGGFIWILMRREPKFAHAQVVTAPLNVYLGRINQI